MMNESNYSIVPPYSGLVDLNAASQQSGMHPEMILEIARSQLVKVSLIVIAGDLYFDCAAVSRLRQIEQLRVGQRAHMRTIRLIMRLTDRAEAAERNLHQLRERLLKTLP
ncbi:MAG: hypothetical protein GWQ05_06160 [Verrucomicrobiaceae bacterium]|nr:hypothetical protein [Verrucomicrobiaceae bacterium]